MPIENFIEHYARLIATEPEKISVDRKDSSDNFAEIIIFAGSNDAGKLIGKDGKMISAIKTMISGCKAKDGIAYRVVVKTV